MQPAIQIKNLGKQYSVAESAPYIALRDIIGQSVRNIFTPGSKKEKFWALKDIDLEVQPGQRLGIIGRNGAGKTTLLRVLSRITAPTNGEAIIRGRIGSLLEVGTGFHPELTGRENIYLNGSILGLKKKEITRQLDAIIDFSGVEKFIDTPLKHYSSGMQMRLAFSVAAHLDAEILLIDEVLAVGDMEFQQKCIGKMEEVSQHGGRTILFVSHNMNYIAGLCDSAILLDKGTILSRGKPGDVINGYTDQVISKYNENILESPAGNGVVGLQALRLTGTSGDYKNNFRVTEKIGIEMEFEVTEPGHILWLGYNLHNADGINIFDTHNVSAPQYSQPYAKGKYRAIAWIPENFLNTGNYYVSCAVFNHLKNIIHFHEKDVSMFHVYDVFDEQTARGRSPHDFPGIVRPLLDWEINQKES